MGSDIQAMTDYKTPSSPSPVRTTQTFWISSAHTLEGLKLPIKHLQGTTSWWADTQCWNTCCVEPTVIDLNDHTIALTSIRMKCFERLVKDDILSSLLHFTYYSLHAGQTKDASPLYYIMAHLKEKETHVRMVFVDFSSLRTIVPQNLVSKLVSLGIGTPVCYWLLDFLTDRPQFVLVGKKSLPHHLPEHSKDPCLLFQVYY